MVVLTKCDFKPMEPGEEPGMPSFEVQGSQGEVSFEGTISVELDGREIHWEGTPDLYAIDPDTNIMCEIIDEINGKHPDVWKEGEQAHGF
jgi:hypothetical protein